MIEIARSEVARAVARSPALRSLHEDLIQDAWVAMLAAGDRSRGYLRIVARNAIVDNGLWYRHISVARVGARRPPIEYVDIDDVQDLRTGADTEQLYFEAEAKQVMRAAAVRARRGRKRKISPEEVTEGLLAGEETWEIARRLRIPNQTIHYSMKQMLEEARNVYR